MKKLLNRLHVPTFPTDGQSYSPFFVKKTSHKVVVVVGEKLGPNYIQCCEKKTTTKKQKNNNNNKETGTINKLFLIFHEEYI